MRYVLFTAMLLALVLPSSGQDLMTHAGFRQFLGEKTQEAVGLHQQGEYDQAIAINTMLLDLPGICAYENARAGIYYNLACAYSLLGRRAEALASLGSAVELGFADREFIEQDSDLDGLRGEPGYVELMAAIRAQAYLRPPNQSVFARRSTTREDNS
jgi:tetratricopeptide (TPR) repeat protein